MSVEKVKEFFKKIEEDEAFRNDFLKDSTIVKDDLKQCSLRLRKEVMSSLRQI